MLVRRPGADIDHGDAAVVGLDQMEGRHLRPALGRRSGRGGVAKPGDDIAGLDEGDAARAAGHRHALAADAGEGIHVELVVGEDDEVLEIVRVGTGVVVEPVQRIVDAGGAEQRERRWRARRPRQRAVDDGVVHGGEVGHVEHVA